MGAKSAAIATLLARLGEALATTPEQAAVAGVASEAIGAVSQAKAFNVREQETSNRLLQTLNEPRPDALQGGPGVNLLSIPGAPGTPPPATLAQVGLPEPQRIDPFRAIALGQAGTQELVAQRQQEKLEVDRALEREKQFAQRLQVIKLQQENAKQLALFNAQIREAEDISRGGEAKRTGEAELLTQDVTAGRREAAIQPTVQQELQTTEVKLRQELAAATTAEERARVSGRLADLEVQKAERDVRPGVAELAGTRALAERTMAPIILSTLVKRLGDSPEVNKLISTFDDPATLRDETARRTNFISMVSLLTPEEKADLEQQFGISLTEIAAGRQPFGAVGLGGVLGADPPTLATPDIDLIGEASISAAVSQARDPDSLLRTGR